MVTTIASTLSDMYGPVLSYVLAIEDNLSQQKDFPKPAIDVATDLQNLLDQISNKALAMGRGRSEVETAKFAIVAWIDEVFARYPQWSAGYTPLQIIYFATNNAGNEFFDKLNDLAEGQIELRALFFMILCLGFVGEHYIDPVSLERLRELTGKKIGLTLPIIAALDQERITPQPYLSQDPHGALRRRTIPWYYWVGALAAALLILGLYALLTREKPDIRPEVNKVIDSFACSHTFAHILGEDEFDIEVTGFLEKIEDKETMRQKLLDIKHVKSVNLDEITIYPFPLCKLLTTLETFTDIADGKNGFPRIRPTSQDLTFRNGDPMIVSLTAPSQTSYVYAAYLQNDGTVIHFIPTDLLPNNKMAANGTMIIGEPGVSPRQYSIQAPFGKDAIFILSSPDPLFDKPRPEIEAAETFFTDLIQKLQKKGTAGNTPVKSDYYLIETAP